MLKNSVKQQEDKLANEDRQQKIDLDKKGWVCQKQWWSQGRRCLTLTDKLSNWKRLPRQQSELQAIRITRITNNQMSWRRSRSSKVLSMKVFVGSGLRVG